MRHVLKHPHYPDLVEAWAADDHIEFRGSSGRCVNDNEKDHLSELSDPFLELLARIDIAEDRLW